MPIKPGLIATMLLAPAFLAGTPGLAADSTIAGTGAVVGTVTAPKPFTAAQVYLRNLEKPVTFMVYTAGGKYRAINLLAGTYEAEIDMGRARFDGELRLDHAGRERVFALRPTLALVDPARVPPMGLRQRSPQPVFIAGREDQMHVIGHETVAPDFHPRAPAPLGEQGTIGHIVVVTEEGRLPPVSPLRDMVRHARHHDSRQPGHRVRP